ncbi:keratin-associated protein 5-8-like [Onychostoma macrolepis]|uniref:keratin-associated protein 5-8-like n=1 Tax=Onychostoma macrolepis TaxID=369639 RepID=UPI00272C1C64|nr:keratin-associated protein 5-8-like [Onychostoma macrolepis]
MSCNKSALNNFWKVGRFPSLRVKSDDCSTVKSSVPVHKNPCSCVACCGREAVVVQDGSHTMSCEKSVNSCPVGCFAITPVDDCKKVSCNVPVYNNPCNHVPPCCDYGFNSNCKKVACCVKPCTKSYHCIPSACDSRCKDDCKKVACCVPVCNIPCNPLYCDNGCKDDCKVACYIKPCSESYNCIPSCCDYGCKGDCKKVAYCVPVCSNPCNPVPSYCDYGCKDDCKKVACNNLCSNPCNYTPPCWNYDCKPVAFKDIKDDCKDVSPC